MKVIILLAVVSVVIATSDPNVDRHRQVVPIIRDDRVQDVEGKYSFDFETGDGIIRSESGAQLEHLEQKPIGQQGNVQFTHPNGERFELKFVADENGYQAESDALPVAPAFPHPIPQFVLDQIAHAAAEDEVARSEGKERAYE